MNVDQFRDLMFRTAEETGIPYEQLMRLRCAELQPLFEFVRIKRKLLLACNQAERDRLRAGEEAWTNMHRLWREYPKPKDEEQFDDTTT